MTDVRDSLRTKREGGALSPDQIDAFMGGYVSGTVPDYQASALLMAIFVHGMEAEELFHWTRAMLESGATLDLEGIAGPKADKHSTGGVGDKVSIALAPAVASCGVRVPMVSGRGLGHTAGTLDKLEAIPGLSTSLDADAFRRVLDSAGAVFAGQTEELVPADRKLYALRDATGLVESIPLIASSILSKKLAEGIDALVLDVKFGSGAFLPERERGEELARTMLTLAARFELSATAFQTSMAQPLGRAVGHVLEVAESLDCLRGEGPEDLRELVVLLGGEMLTGTGVADDAEEGRGRIETALDYGDALLAFERIVEEQGGDPACVARPELLPLAPDVEEWRAPASGNLSFTDCRRVGLALCSLGGCRVGIDDAIDPAVGIVWRRKAGAEVKSGDVLCDLHHRAGRGLDEARAHLTAAVAFDGTVEPPPLVAARLEARGSGPV